MALLDHPTQLATLRREPEAMRGAVEEILRGANLARREIAILFEELLARTRDIEILAPPAYSGLTIDNPVLGAVRDLPVRIT